MSSKFNWTPLRTAFCEQMLVCDFNATAAYKAAGGPAKHPDRAAAQLMALPEIKERIEELKAKRSDETGIDAQYVLNRLQQIDEMDVADLMDSEGNIKPIQQWPKVWRTTISGFDIQSLMVGDIESVIRKIKWPDKVKNLELIGKHVGVQAFKEKVELTGQVEMTNRILEARKRAKASS